MTRKEAIDILMSANVWNDEERTALATLIPELRESEDERIRKELIAAIDEGRVFDIDKEVADRWTTYLEKQKKNPKSADSIPADCASDAKCEDRSPKHSDSDGTDIRDTPAYWRGWDDAMKQKEQKPAEWREEDIDKMVNARARKSGTTKTEMQFYRQGIKDTLEHIRPSWKPSEEQMKELELIINGKAVIRTDFIRTLYNDLKKLI